MKQLLFPFVILIVLSSCSESFKTRNPDLFNQIIAIRTDIATPEALIKFYYTQDREIDFSNITIESEPLGGSKYEITLIDENLQDDSMSGEKIVMTAELIGQTWTVHEIKANWKCHDGRGHTNWGTELCI